MDLPPHEREGMLKTLLWERVKARQVQLEPEGWVDENGEHIDIWFLLGGRGSGKTRTGAETISKWAQRFPGTRWIILAPTFADVRDTMIEGESGLLNVLPDSVLLGGSRDRAYNRSQLQIQLRNGSRIDGYSSEKADRLRGPQSHGGWLDEPASFRDADKYPMADNSTFSNLMFGARLTAPGWDKTRFIVTGTPKPCTLLAGDSSNAGLLSPNFSDFNVKVSRMTSKENLENLSPVYQKLIERLEGTNIGRQEIYAELLTDVQGAMWRQSWIVVDNTIEPNHGFREIVVSVDPAGSTGRASDETGIIVAGIDFKGMFWVLEDLSGKWTPEQWASMVWDAAARWEAGTVVFERNFGGDMGPEVLRLHKSQGTGQAHLQVITAARGKVIRAEPAALLYEPSEGYPAGSRVRHSQHFPLLVDQMCRFTKSSKNDDRVDALVWALIWLSEFSDDYYVDGGDAAAPWYSNLGRY